MKVKLFNVDKNIPPNDEVVDNLAVALKEAQEGELRSIVSAGLYNNGDITHFCCLDKKSKIDIYQLIGKLHILISCLEKEYDMIDENMEQIK